VPARREDAGHFAQGARARFHVAQAEGDGDGIERGVGEGEIEGVGENRVFEAFAPGAIEHGLAEIGAGDAGAGACALDGESEIAAAGGEIKNGAWLPSSDEGGGAGAPEEIESAGKQMVGEVVPSRDGREEGVDKSGLLLLQKPGVYFRGQITRIKKTKPSPVRIVRATRKLWRKESQVID
jgi:hypothetical protein